MNQKIIVKSIFVVTLKSGAKNSITKHLPLGEKYIFKFEGDGKEIDEISVTFDEAKFVYTDKDCLGNLDY